MWARAKLLTALVLAIAPALALAPALGPTPALATPGDVAATHAYIDAGHALAQSAVAAIRPAQAKIESLNRSLARECPLIASGSPQTEASQSVSYEVSVALWSISYGADAAGIRRFLAATGGLRWSNRAIARAAASFARNLRGFATLPLPRLCADVGAWKASGYHVVPASTLNLDQREQSLELNPVSPRLLAPYERGSDARTVASTIGLEHQIEESEFGLGQDDWIQLLGTLGLSE